MFSFWEEKNVSFLGGIILESKASFQVKSFLDVAPERFVWKDINFKVSLYEFANISMRLRFMYSGVVCWRFTLFEEDLYVRTEITCWAAPLYRIIQKYVTILTPNNFCILWVFGPFVSTSTKTANKFIFPQYWYFLTEVRLDRRWLL